MTHEYHTPVLADEVLQYLLPTAGRVYVDGTLGDGGHAERIMTAMQPGGLLIGFDQDSDAARVASERLSRYGSSVIVRNENVASLREVLADLNIPEIHGLLLDLGVSSRQINEARRGFSFQQDARLDMRMDPRQAFDAWTVVNQYNEHRLADVLWQYGEERRSRSIAKRIVGVRANGSTIDTTAELAAIVTRAVGGQFAQKSLARVFQAIRIEVNRELEHLRTVLQDAVEVLAPGGRIVVIAYHSLEDRIVKTFFRERSRRSIPSGSRYVADQIVEPQLKVLTKKPVEPSEPEIHRNVRARSAKLRAAERI
jgi:16S rRNA (cytosine1402-N4)-methyltransferase